MAALPAVLEEIVDEDVAVESFPDDLKSLHLLHIMRSVQDKITRISFETWDLDDLPNYSLLQLLQALCGRITEMEHSTLTSLKELHAWGARLVEDEATLTAFEQLGEAMQQRLAELGVAAVPES